MVLTVPIIDHLFIHSLTIKRNTRASDGQGGWVETPATSSTPNGRVNPVSGKDLEVAGKMRAQVTHCIYLPPGTDVLNGDVVYYGTRSFEVKVPNISPSKEIYKKALVLEVQEAA